MSALFEDPSLRLEIERHSRKHSILKDDVLLSAGDAIHFLPIVETGSLRVIRQHDDDREVFLYHLYPGQTCAVAISCCQAGRKSTIKAVAEADTDLLLVPVAFFDTLDRFPEWKRFVNETYASRFGELLDVIDLIAFSSMDKQLLHYLHERARAHKTSALVITHQQIADELHSHREAISRLLRTMEQKNMVRLGRNVIELLTDK